jgi:ubiquinone/menaquinone biosynthesis C-methylase UbiE
MDKDYAQYLLDKMQENYNLIAEDFSRTRRYIWKDFQPLAEYSKAGDKVLDLGCGNGRLLELLGSKKIHYLGVDNVPNLIQIARKRHPSYNFQLADALSLPFADDSFDKIYSIAVLHHIPSQELRLKFLIEARRVLKSKGLLILTVWNLWQRRGLKPNLKYAVLKILGLSKLDFKDVFIPWVKIYQRYFHCFSKGELKKLAGEAGFGVKEVGILQRPDNKGSNVYLIAENLTK